jgi:hypothetical protein
MDDTIWLVIYIVLGVIILTSVSYFVYKVLQKYRLRDIEEIHHARMVSFEKQIELFRKQNNIPQDWESFPVPEKGFQCNPIRTYLTTFNFSVNFFSTLGKWNTFLDQQGIAKVTDLMIDTPLYQQQSYTFSTLSTILNQYNLSMYTPSYHMISIQSKSQKLFNPKNKDLYIAEMCVILKKEDVPCHYIHFKVVLESNKRNSSTIKVWYKLCSLEQEPAQVQEIQPSNSGGIINYVSSMVFGSTPTPTPVQVISLPTIINENSIKNWIIHKVFNGLSVNEDVKSEIPLNHDAVLSKVNSFDDSAVLVNNMKYVIPGIFGLLGIVLTKFL